MKHKTLFLLLLIVMCITTYAQNYKNKTAEIKCKVVHDKALDRDFYENLDTDPMEDSLLDWLKFIAANFKTPNKIYKEGQTLRFVYVIEADGKAAFGKLLNLKDDKDIEVEAKRMVDLLPPCTPGTCNGTAVASRVNIQFPLKSKKYER